MNDSTGARTLVTRARSTWTFIRAVMQSALFRSAVAFLIISVATVVVGLGPKARLRSPGSPIEVWEFVKPSTRLWISPNASVSRGPLGLVLIPTDEPGLLSSGALDLKADRYVRVRLRLIAPEPTEGRLGAIVDTSQGTRRVSVPFEVRGARDGDTIAVSFPEHMDAGGTLQEVMLIPSSHPQPVTVVSIALETRWGWFGARLEDVLSPWPGNYAAHSGLAINSLPPPSLWGRSIWVVLAPVVAGMACVGLFIRTRKPIWRRMGSGAPWMVIGIVWIVGMGFMFYHQVWALSVEVDAFGGKMREEAYRLLDGGPLLADMAEVSRLLDGQSRVEFTIAADAPPIWPVRAAHYLFPIIIRAGSPMRIHYFGKPHSPCQKLVPTWKVVRDADRYCLFQISG